jgi:hypothetical protein
MDKIKLEEGELKFEFPYFQCPNEIFDKDFEIIDQIKNVKRNMDNYEKLILIYLFRCCNNGKVAFPSYNTISKRCCCSRRKAMYSVDNLLQNGFIEKKNRGYVPDNEGQVRKNYSNVYTIKREKFV